MNFGCALAVIGLDLVLIMIELTLPTWYVSALKWTQTILSCMIKMVFCVNYALILTTFLNFSNQN